MLRDMMRLAVSLGVVVVMFGAGVARAQPGLTPVRPRVSLTDEERELIARGEISEGERLGGAFVGIWLGFGIGHAVQGRYGERGWLFTLTDLAGAGLVTAAVATCFQLSFGSDRPASADCGESGLFIAALAFLVGSRLWQGADLVKEPRRHNERVRRAREKAAWAFGAAPTLDGSGGQIGFALRFLDRPDRWPPP
jgi:hypothetical protein